MNLNDPETHKRIAERLFHVVTSDDVDYIASVCEAIAELDPGHGALTPLIARTGPRFVKLGHSWINPELVTSVTEVGNACMVWTTDEVSGTYAMPADEVVALLTGEAS